MIKKIYIDLLLPTMRNKAIILISIIIIFILLFNFQYKIDNDNILTNHENNDINESSYYLNHNILIKNEEKCNINNQKIIIFQNNVSIIDNGYLYLNNSEIITNNTNLNLKICNGTLFMDDSIIDIKGRIYFYNSSIIINNSSILNQTTLYIYGKNSNLSLYNSNINYSQFNQKNYNYTSGMLYNKCSPQDKQGIIPLKSNIYYNSSYSNKLNIHFQICGDNNGTGYMPIYEYGSLIYNISIPVHTGNYWYNISIDLPEDLLPSDFTNSSYFKMVIPTNNYPQAHPAGEDGNITYTNITIYINSNDTENYFGFGKYNIIFQNSTILAYNSSFNTNFKNYYIYQRILNPYKKSILMYNSSFYSISSYFGSGKYINSPFHNINSSAYFYGIKNIYFTNGYNYFNLDYIVKPNLLNNSLNNIADYYNNLIKSKIKNNNALLFDIQNNDSNKYYGDYYTKNGNNMFNFSFMPIPRYNQTNNIYFNVNIGSIKFNYILPEKFIAFDNNMVKLNITSLYFVSDIRIDIYINNNIYYKNNVTLNSSKSKDLNINIINDKYGTYNMTISINEINKKYLFNQFFNKTIKVNFLKNVNISILYNYSYINNNLILNNTILNKGMDNISSNFYIYFYNNSGIAKIYKNNITVNKKSLYNMDLRLNIKNITKIDEIYYNYSNEINIRDKIIKNKIVKYYINISTNLNNVNWILTINNKTFMEDNSNISIKLVPGTYNIIISKDGYYNESYLLHINSNESIIASLQKEIKKPSAIKINNYKYYYIIGITLSIVAVISFLYLYTFKTIKCPKCGTLYFKSYDKCPVCLYNRKNKDK